MERFIQIVLEVFLVLLLLTGIFISSVVLAIVCASAVSIVFGLFRGLL